MTYSDGNCKSASCTLTLLVKSCRNVVFTRSLGKQEEGNKEGGIKPKTPLRLRPVCLLRRPARQSIVSRLCPRISALTPSPNLITAPILICMHNIVICVIYTDNTTGGIYMALTHYRPAMPFRNRKKIGSFAIFNIVLGALAPN